MEPITAMLMGGSSLLGSIFSSNTSAANTEANIAMQQQTNMMNAQEAQKNRDFQQQMSSTAYQRASTDMKAAGLNPMMMTGGAMSASSPSGSVATMQAPKSEKTSPLGGLGAAVSSAVEGFTKAKYIDKMSEEIANIQAETDKQHAITDNIRQTTRINEPDARDALIKMGYPEALANALVYGHDISKGVSEAGGAFWDVVGGGLKKLGLGPSAGTVKQLNSGGDKAFTPTQNRRIMDMIDQSSSSSAKAIKPKTDFWGRPADDKYAKDLYDFLRGPGSKLGGRE